MPTPGELAYFRQIGADGLKHAAHKPWSDPQCGLYLMELGAIMGLLPPSGRILDLGCGTGWTSILYAQRGYEVVGQELVLEAIVEGEKLKNQYNLKNLTFVHSDFESLTLSNEFDAAIFFDCLHHSLDETKALQSAFNALKSGGILITSEPGYGHHRRSRATIEQFGTTERDMPPARIVRAGRKVGFQKRLILPHASDFYLAFYRQHGGKTIQRLLQIPGASSLAGLFSILFYRHIAGIVVLQKP
jgi:SAM-dependent methyltransferase